MMQGGMVGSWQLARFGPLRLRHSRSSRSGSPGRRPVSCIPGACSGTTIQSTPALATGNGLVAYTQEDGRIYVRKTSDGALQWRFNLVCATTSYPAIGADGTVYAASGAG
jgi:hypothetical protein